MKLVIDRSKWLRGEGSTNSQLRRLSDGKMCCLGFHALACGADKKLITGSTQPLHLCEIRGFKYPSGQTWAGTATPLGSSVDWLGPYMFSRLTEINDAANIDDATREAWLIEGFRVLGGVEIEFVN